MESIVSEVMEAYLEGSKAEIDIDGFLDWRKAKRRVMVKLVNYAENTELLKDVPHRKFLDLAEAYYAVMGVGGGRGMGSVLIHYSHLGLWGIGEEELAEAAHENCRRYLPAEIKSMDEIVRELAGIQMPPEEISAMKEMYIATNRWKLYGAAVMLFPEMLRGLAKRCGGDLYILPSSVHEVILLSAGKDGKEGLAEIVEEVNRTQLEPEEKLSDTVYRYSYERDEVVIA